MPKEIKSKYQKKVYEEKEYFLDETTCPNCNVPFMIDYRYLKLFELDGDFDYATITCPYCGKKHYEHL